MLSNRNTIGPINSLFNGGIAIPIPPASGNARVLIAGAGSGGSEFAGSGGNAGDVTEVLVMAIPAGPNNVTIGVKGIGAPGTGAPTNGGDGGDTTFNGVTAAGGIGPPGDFPNVGGQGAGGPAVGVDGGPGVFSDISGVNTAYGGGGGGSNSGGPPAGLGGDGVGGNGNEEFVTLATNGITPGSAGGGDWFGNPAGDGFDGIVIIRYKTDGSDHISPLSTGGVITVDGLFTIHTFTANGIFNCITV